jgi:hypothetical protein
MKYDNPIFEEVRRRRMAIPTRFDHDLEKYIAHLRDIEQDCQDRVVNQVTVIRPTNASRSSRRNPVNLSHHLFATALFQQFRYVAPEFLPPLPLLICQLGQRLDVAHAGKCRALLPLT